jgi:hypothetical protein
VCVFNYVPVLLTIPYGEAMTRGNNKEEETGEDFFERGSKRKVKGRKTNPTGQVPY